MKPTKVGSYKDWITLKEPSSIIPDGIGGKEVSGERIVNQFWGNLKQANTSLQLRLGVIKRATYYVLHCRYVPELNDRSFHYWIECDGKKYAIHTTDCDFRDDYCNVICYLADS